MENTITTERVKALEEENKQLRQIIAENENLWKELKDAKSNYEHATQEINSIKQKYKDEMNVLLTSLRERVQGAE